MASREPTTSRNSRNRLEFVWMLDPKLTIKDDNQNPLESLVRSIQGSSFEPNEPIYRLTMI
jgi:hypothetical protein